MKSLLALLLLCSLGAQAADWKKVKVEESIYKDLAENLGLYSYSYKLVSKSSEEKIERSLKQMTFKARNYWGLYSMPEWISVEEVSSLKDSSFFKDQWRYEPKPVNDSMINDLQTFMKKRDQVSLYQGIDGNSFGDCSNLYLFDKASQESLLLSVCYSE